jgi:aminopeptidase N
MRRLVAANCLAWSTLIPLMAAPIPRPYTVENYDVSVQVDLVKQRLTGEVSIRFHSRVDNPISALELDAGGLVVESVMEGQSPQFFERAADKLAVVLTNPLRTDERRTLTVRYSAGPAAGLKFFSDQAYTSATSDWMVCNDGPGERATLHLTIAAPQDLKVAGSGQLTASRVGEGRSITEWRVDSATAPSWFGFAIGNFSENTSDAEGVKLRVLGAVPEVFEPTAAAIRYLAERSGKRYPGPSYTQVFVHGSAGHSMAAGLTLLPESSAKDIGKNRDALWLLASELAHQWYGIGIAPKDWSDLWLSEGVPAFLADGFLGQRFGQEAFEREVQHSLQIHNQLRNQGKDRALSDTEWRTRQEADGEILVHKGVCFLYLVQEMIGETTLSNGLRLYTHDQWDQAVTSEDFERAFQATGAGHPRSGKPSALGARKNNAKTLDDLFAVWVYGVPAGNTKKGK